MMFFSSLGSLGMSSSLSVFSDARARCQLGLFLAREIAHLRILLHLARLADAVGVAVLRRSPRSRMSECSLPSFCIWPVREHGRSASIVDSSS
jgi:hypothetical protein